jgi:hypothetical protein
LRGTARDSGRNATGVELAAGADPANSEGTKPAAAIIAPNLAKNDLREQGELTCVWRFKIPDSRRSRVSNVKQNFHPTPLPGAY